MNLSITWINQTPEGRTILLSKSSTLANGMRSIGNQAGFVSLATKAQQLKFKVGQVIELPDNAELVDRTFTDKVTGESKTVQTWAW